MEREYAIGMLWVDGPLSYVEALCAQSFLDAGHHVKLYYYGDVLNVPEGVELVHGDTVLQIQRFLRHGRTGSFALFSDVFRYHLLCQQDRMIWADLDAYCVRPFETETGHFFGWESEMHVNGGVLGLPPDSEALGLLLEMTKDEYGIPEWYSDPKRRKLEAMRDAGHPMHVSDMTWGTWGPHALTHYLQKTGESKYALPVEGLYPISFGNRRALIRGRARHRVEAMVTDGTYSVHFYGRRIREKLVQKGGLPEEGSWMAAALEKHSIDTSQAPVFSRKEPDVVSDTAREAEASDAHEAPDAGAVPVNLTDLADRYGSDKGSTKHRYTELYHMLFHPYRQRTFSFLEMGLLIGGPEHGNSPDRETNDAPSVRMWLEYFPNADIHGLDVSDFSWFEHDRFTFHRCDMGDRAQIAAAADQIDPAPEIVVDDASHASHHQQFAFLEIFPRLPSGALYVIEDLRWQPDMMEIDGYTKTAALFRSWLNARSFSHSDPEIEDAFNALSYMVSGCIIEPVRYIKGKVDQVLVVHKR
ncbi:MAG: hypothetical protein AAF484_14645 [Pseudomonadota bacterium]